MTNQEITSNETLQNDNDLTFAVGSNEVWEFDMLVITKGNGNRDIRIAFDVPAGATIHWSGLGADVTWNSPDEAMAILRSYYRTGSAEAYFGTILNTPFIVRIRGMVVNGETAGDVTLQWSPRSNGGAPNDPITVQAGSFLRAGKFE